MNKDTNDEYEDRSSRAHSARHESTMGTTSDEHRKEPRQPLVQDHLERQPATAYGVEARDGRYQIQRARLWKDDLTWSWVQHMAEKEWVDIDDFTEALRIARVEHSRTHERKYWHKRAADP